MLTLEQASSMMTIKLALYLILASAITIVGSAQARAYMKNPYGKIMPTLTKIEYIIMFLIVVALVADIFTPFPG